MTTSNHNITSYTAYLEEIAEESDGAESLLDYDDVPYPDVPTNGGGIPVHAVAAEEIGGSNDNDNLPNLEQVLQEVTEIFRNTSRLNEIVDSSHEDGESLPLQHVRNEHDDDGYSYNSSLCSSETTEGHVAHLEAALQNHSAMKVQVCNILRSRQQPQLQDELLLGSDASVSASSSAHLIDSVIISDDTYDCNSSASSSSSSSSSSLSLLVSPNVSPKRLQRQSSDCGKVDIGGTAPSAVNTSGVSSLTSTPFRVSPNKNHHPESSAVPHTNGVYNAAVNTTVPSLAARRKVTVVVRVCPTKNKEADTSSHCLVNPSSDEVANGDNENEGRFKGGIIAVNPSAFGSYECPNIQMVLNLSRMVDELVSVSFKQPYECEILFLNASPQCLLNAPRSVCCRKMNHHVIGQNDFFLMMWFGLMEQMGKKVYPRKIQCWTTWLVQLLKMRLGVVSIPSVLPTEYGALGNLMPCSGSKGALRMAFFPKLWRFSFLECSVMDTG